MPAGQGGMLLWSQAGLVCPRKKLPLQGSLLHPPLSWLQWGFPCTSPDLRCPWALPSSLLSAQVQEEDVFPHSSLQVLGRMSAASPVPRPSLVLGHMCRAPAPPCLLQTPSRGTHSLLATCPPLPSLFSCDVIGSLSSLAVLSLDPDWLALLLCHPWTPLPWSCCAVRGMNSTRQWWWALPFPWAPSAFPWEQADSTPGH